MVFYCVKHFLTLLLKDYQGKILVCQTHGKRIRDPCLELTLGIELLSHLKVPTLPSLMLETRVSFMVICPLQEQNINKGSSTTSTPSTYHDSVSPTMVLYH